MLHRPYQYQRWKVGRCVGLKTFFVDFADFNKLLLGVRSEGFSTSN
ncbi:hypothetical protein HMPREF9997_01587 [Corynebacterium durum F0235]|uniref:Uncharacterized protein n=1 Tax=Corynebacterium durum F0235 TaxID=1035195 RepID=L1MF96_9CORY|nr:hypothetical protein HMPREF9997_01587 [Corynebacterium durum F0235]